MKKFIAIVASAVLAMSAFSLVACDITPNDEDNVKLPSAPAGNYEEVDTSDPAKKEEFVEEVKQKFDITKIFGDMTSENWSFGLAADITAKAEASITGHNVQTGPDTTTDITMSGNVTLNSSSKVKISAATDAEALLPFDILASVDANVKGNVNLPDMIYQSMGEQASTIKSLITDFDYTAKAYLDNEYLYASIPTKIVSVIPEEAGIPASGKIKVPLEMISGGMGSDVPDISYGETGIKLTDDAVEEVPGMDVSSYVSTILAMLEQYNVSVSVSTDNGYTVKLNAGLESVYALIADLVPIEGATADTIAELVAEYGKVSTCEIEAYISIDAEGMFSGLGIALNVAATANVKAGALGEFAPAMTGSAKLKYGVSVSKYDGTVTLPSDLSSYVDVTAAE
ncbi:MAG: hypothetical protein J1G05_06270 [Clostridiales bacterium]|nr:hypothetical protein [Clostridiales bacterium]